MKPADIRLALLMLVALAGSWLVHEFAHAACADRLGDPTPRRFGRLTLNPRAHFDPFGSGLLPGLLLLLVAAGSLPPVFAYGKPLALNPFSARNPGRSTVWIALAGPLANLALAGLSALAYRFTPHGLLGEFLQAALIVNVILFVFNLMPIPGLDGARLVSPLLPPRAREVYMRLDQYLPLFMLVAFFLLAGPLLGIVQVLGHALCRSLSPGGCLL